jgi:predicted Zn-dependent peptidase
MLEFEKFTLDNGLKIIVCPDNTTELVTVNILYDIGAKDEKSSMTGFAHLFEHLMFGGSVNIPDYDTPLQMAGGENNAFTNNDYTNYYLTLPAINIETAFWLESDRMLSLAFTPESLEVQRKVVIEEFKQNYINQPYGDVSHLLRALTYKKHPYRWPTIGLDVSHIEKATLQNVKDFFFSHYAPNNAILTVVGNVDLKTVKQLAEKWFAPIPARDIAPRNLPQEPPQTQERRQVAERSVPADRLYMAYHMSDRLSDEFYIADVISDLLSNGNSSRLYQHLVQENPLFSSLDAYISGSIDAGLFHISGTLSNGVSLEEAEKAVEAEITAFSASDISDIELEKVHNIYETNFSFSNYTLGNRAFNLSLFELLGDANLINDEINRYRSVSKQAIKATAEKLFSVSNRSVLYYRAK